MAIMKVCKWCGSDYDMTRIASTASWKINYCCMRCAKEAGAVK